MRYATSIGIDVENRPRTNDLVPGRHRSTHSGDRVGQIPQLSGHRLELPELTVEELPLAADWVELNTLIECDGIVAHADVERVFETAGLVGSPRDDFGPGSTTFADPDLFSDDDAVGRHAELVWQELVNRAQLLQDGYPFEVQGDALRRTSESWKKVPAYTMLLLLDIGRKYSTRIGVVADAKTSRLFEKIVQAAKHGLFGGASVRFGWPREPDWPTAIDPRIQQLANGLGLQVEDLTRKTRPRDKDRGLDVATRLFGDDASGSLFILTQRALGQHWRTKRGEPSIAAWQSILNWDARLERAIAVPWRLDESFDCAQTYRHFDAIVMDRPRLLRGRPDRFIDATVGDTIVRWCQGQIRKLPCLE